MKRIQTNNVLGVMVGVACLVGGLLVRRRSLRCRSAWPSQRVVIMGGARGLGFLLAREFVRRGASVVIAARVDEELVYARQSILRRWGSAPQQVNAIRCDIREVPTSSERFSLRWRFSVESTFSWIVRASFKLGLWSPCSSRTSKAMAVHYYVPLAAALAVLPEMRARRSGTIVNISSISSEGKDRLVNDTV